MARPPKRRLVACKPGATLFRPAGTSALTSPITRLGLDELEALRLVDGQGLHQAQAARHMAVSRATVGRILTRARRKVARALADGHALSIIAGAAPIEHAPPEPTKSQQAHETH